MAVRFINDYPPFLTARQAAELLGVDVRTIYRHKKDLPVRRVGRTVRIERDALFAALKNNTIGAE